jgi:hypothetical protein
MADRSAIDVNVVDGAFNEAETPAVLDTSNGNVIVTGEAGGKILLYIHLSAATAEDTVTVVAGDAEQAFRSGLGDLVYTCAGGAVELVLGPIETARFLQDDGQIYIDTAGETIAGTVEAFELP